MIGFAEKLLITTFFSSEKVCIFLNSKDFSDCDETEKWFGTKYKVEDIPSNWTQHHLKGIENEFHLPSENKFIAEDTTLKVPTTITQYPVKIMEENMGELYFKQDDKFKQPRAYLYFFLCSEVPLKSVGNAVALDVICNCICQLMTEATYPADIAQLSFSLYPNERGLLVKVSGLNDKLLNLLCTILDYLDAKKLEPALTDELFRAVKEQTKKNYYNSFIQPMKLVRELRLDILQVDHYNAVERHSEIDSITKEDSLKAEMGANGFGENFLDY